VVVVVVEIYEFLHVLSLPVVLQRCLRGRITQAAQF